MQPRALVPDHSGPIAQERVAKNKSEIGENLRKDVYRLLRVTSVLLAAERFVDV